MQQRHEHAEGLLEAWQEEGAVEVGVHLAQNKRAGLQGADPLGGGEVRKRGRRRGEGWGGKEEDAWVCMGESAHPKSGGRRRAVGEPVGVWEAESSIERTYGGGQTYKGILGDEGP